MAGIAAGSGVASDIAADDMAGAALRAVMAALFVLYRFARRQAFDTAKPSYRKTRAPSARSRRHRRHRL